MKICRIEVKYLLDVTTALNQLTLESVYNFSSEGLKVVEMDNANIAMIQATIQKENFIELSEELNKKPQKVGINTNNLLKLLKNNKKGSVTLSLCNDNNNLNLLFDNELNTEMPLLDLSNNKEQKIPDLTPTTTITIDSKAFKQAIISLDSISESVTFKAENNNFMLIAESDLNKANMPIKSLGSFENSTSKYAMEYLKKFFKTLIDEKVKLMFGTDYPLQVIQDKRGVKIHYVLAPRIEND